MGSLGRLLRVRPGRLAGIGRAAHRRPARVRAVIPAVTSLALGCGMLAAAGPARASAPHGSAAVISDTAIFKLQTRVATASPAEPGDHLKVTLGGVDHAAPPAPAWACPTGVWVLVLGRASLDEVSSTDYPLCSEDDVSRLAAALKKVPNTEKEPRTVIVNSLNHHPGEKSLTLSGLGEALSLIGAPGPEFADLDLGTTGFSVYGIPGLTAGQAHTAQDSLAAEAAVPAGSPVPASVNGTLVPDDHGNYTLTMLDYGLYDISPDGAITINGHTYPVPARSASFLGGFHLLVVNRRTLQPISDTLYQTSGGAREPRQDEYRMYSYLARLAADHDEGVLLFLAAVGKPFPGYQLSQLPAGPPPSSACPAGAALTATAFTITCTFSFAGPDPWDGKEQKFAIPQDVAGVPGIPVTSLHVVLRGGYGGFAVPGGKPSPEGGDADQVTADLPVGTNGTVHPGQTLYAEVGGNGTSGGDRAAGRGGWNGGASGGASCFACLGWPGGGGGGASDIRTLPVGDSGSLSSRLVVAAGGGGAGGSNQTAQGGDGGNARNPGAAGYDPLRGGGGGGGAGTASGGGEGGAAGAYLAARGITGAAGIAGAGGKGGEDTTTSAGYFPGEGGGGGGGYYGGGGGGTGAPRSPEEAGGGGGGGSNLLPAGGTAERFPHLPGDRPASVAISYPSVYGPTLAQLLRPFGATPTLIDNLWKSPRYALVGALSPPTDLHAGSFGAPEASPGIRDGATGQLQGVLARGNRNMWYGPAAENTPVVQTISGKEQPPTVVNYGLYNVISHVSKPWPVPAGTPGSAAYKTQAAALGFLSEQVCGGPSTRCPDIRAEYDSYPETISAWRRDMGKVTFPSGQHDFDLATFTLVKDQLVTELGDVYVVDGLREAMHTLLSDQQQMLGPALQSAYRDVRSSIEVDGDAHVKSIMYTILGLITSLAEKIPGVGHAVGVISAIVEFVTELVTDLGGENKGTLETTVNDLADQAANGFTASLESLTQTFGYLFSDWGKLSAVADGLKHDTDAWEIKDPGKYVRAMTNAIKISYYQALVPLEYQINEAQAAPTTDMRHWCIVHESNSCILAGGWPEEIGRFTYPSSAVYSFPVHAPRLSFADAHDNILAGLGHRDDGPYFYFVGHPLPAELMEHMEASGLYAPYLFLRWPFERNVCAGPDWTVSLRGVESCS